VVAFGGWRAYRRRFRNPFPELLAELIASDFASADAVRADQDRRLRETVAWAARTVPYYRELFRREAIDPGSIQHVDDLARLPTLDKETVRARAGDLRSDGIARRHILSNHSSGTTGTALQLFQTRATLAWEYAVSWRQRSWAGFSPGDRFVAFGGQRIVPLRQETPPFWRRDPARGRLLLSLYHMTPGNLAAYAQALAQPGYEFWQGYPSSIALVCDYLLERGVALAGAAPRAVFTSSETLLDSQRERIERATGGAVLDRYGHTEAAVSVSQCPAAGYHIDTEFGVVEIDPVERGENWVRGEVIATGFANRAMPLLRYRTGDVATWLVEPSCPCGRARPLLERIDGRIEDYVLTPDGRRVGRMDHIFKDALEVKEAQIYQPSLAELVVRLVPRADFCATHQRALEREFRARLGNEIAISWELVETLPRSSSGKLRAVVSDLDAAKLSGTREDQGAEG